MEHAPADGGVLLDLDEQIARVLRDRQRAVDARYQLEPIQRLMAALGSPHKRLRVVHLAATSGKTSTSWVLRGYLQALGLRTGLTISPHVTSPCERVQIDGEPVTATEFAAAVDAIGALAAEHQFAAPSYFELVLGVALHEFERTNVDIAVLETGIGGLLDATNIADGPDKVCVIGRIGLDHTEILGETVEEIAAQKSGIIHPGNAVVALRQGAPVDDVITARAVQAGADIIWVDEGDLRWRLPEKAPQFQRANVALAQATLFALASRGWLARRPELGRLPAPVFPPGRFEWMSVSGRPVLLDGAHNPQKLAALFDSLPLDRFGELAVLAGFVRSPGAKLQAMLDVIATRTRRFGYVEFTADQDFRDRRSFASDEVRQAAVERGLECVVSETEDDATDWLLAQRGQPVVLGSLYLVSRIRTVLLARGVDGP
jgi:dihydrofolate synthase/folylpolyglutamate synthase